MIASVSPARVLVLVLRALNLGTTAGDWRVTYGLMPAELPTRRISVMTTTPVVHGKDVSGSHSCHYGVQVLVRADEQEAAYGRTMAIVNRLCQITPPTKITVVVSSMSYDVEHVALASGPAYLRTQENKDAELYAVNFLFTCREY